MKGCKSENVSAYKLLTLILLHLGDLTIVLPPALPTDLLELVETILNNQISMTFCGY